MTIDDLLVALDKELADTKKLIAQKRYALASAYAAGVSGLATQISEKLWDMARNK